MVKFTIFVVAMFAIATSVAASSNDPQPAAATSSASNADDTKPICRKESEIGSLVRSHRTCLTAKQWATTDLAHQNEARRIVSMGTGKPDGN